MLIFVKRISISKKGLPTRLKLEIDIFEHFLPTCLIDIFFSQIVLTFENLLAFIFCFKYIFFYYVGDKTIS